MANIYLPGGVSFSWADLTLLAYGQPIIGYTGLSVVSRQNKTNEYGAGNKPIYRGRGRKEFEATLKGVPLDELKPIRLAAPNNSLLDIAPSDFVVVGVNASNGLTTKITLKMAEFLEDPFDSNEGDTILRTDVKLIIADIEYV